MIDFTLLLISISLSSVGSFLDIYSTRIFIKDLGTEFEANKRVRNVISKYGYKMEILIEVFLIILLGVGDSLSLLYHGFIFLGFIVLIVRGLVATHNFQGIAEYRTIGITAYKERARLRKQAFQNVSRVNRIRWILPYLVEALICFVIYGMLLTVDFPLVILSRYFVIGLAFFFIVMAYYS